MPGEGDRLTGSFFFRIIFLLWENMSAYKLSFALWVQAPATLTEEVTFLRAIALVPEAFRSPEDSDQKVIQFSLLSPLRTLRLCGSFKKGESQPRFSINPSKSGVAHVVN